METFEQEIAIIGMTGRFPGAKSIDQFWQNLCNGRESITFFSDEELLAAGISPGILDNPHYVKAKSMLEDIDLFDASFFGFTPREAEILDPQHRIFLECAWEALESAGYAPEAFEGRIGVYAGASMSSYLLFHLYMNREVVESMGGFQLMVGNDKDFLPTRVSYKLNLTGPSVNINTTCSSSLVAVHFACQSLLNGECDLALAGGVSITATRKASYMYQEGGIASPDGHCRAFDSKAQGTVDGNGAGIVVLKRLPDALADGDTIHAVIKSTAINNDGAFKIGYTAPSANGQAGVIAEALALSGVDPESITYIEAHGTGTTLGDPIELAALSQVFGSRTSKKGFCAIGSVKTNIGHLGAAAGIAGLIKTVLALKHRQIPPSLHFAQPNPKIDFANSPFYVNASLAEWQTKEIPRHAGVSSFGLGGTNAHAILEEAPPRTPSGSSRPWQLLTLSAKTTTALESATAQLAAYLQLHPELPLSDVAYTLQVGRQTFAWRRMLVCQGREEAIQALATGDPRQIFTHMQESGERPVVFLFPGQGAQYVHMAEELYQQEPLFHEQVERCATILQERLGCDLRTVIYPTPEQEATAAQQLQQTWLTQPALFVIEYALAQLWISWGVRPEAMIGHSIGEYVAACLAGVFSLEDALALVTTRGRLIQSLPAGAMLSVALSERDLTPLPEQELTLAAHNAPGLCVVSGPAAAIADLQAHLSAQGVDCRLLHTSHAFHSKMLDPILEQFAKEVRQVQLNPPIIPYISNVTGTWIAAGEATDPSYWARQLRHTVRFAEGLQELRREPERILLEVGPGRVLSTLVRQQSEQNSHRIVLSSVRHPQDGSSDVAFLLSTAGKLWLAGAPLNRKKLYAHERRHRLPLPTYPFERQRYWIEPQSRHHQPDSSRPRSGALASGENQGSAVTFSLLSSSASSRPYVAPGNAIESAIADIWQELFGMPQIGIYDNFFELGGHSLLATQITTRLRDTFEIELSLNSFFESLTIAALAQLIERKLIEKVEALSEDEAQSLL